MEKKWWRNFAETWQLCKCRRQSQERPWCCHFSAWHRKVNFTLIYLLTLHKYRMEREKKWWRNFAETWQLCKCRRQSQERPWCCHFSAWHRKVNFTLIYLLTLHKYRMEREKKWWRNFAETWQLCKCRRQSQERPWCCHFSAWPAQFSPACPSLACWNFTSNGEIACAQWR